jgi:5-methylcytosine-specific restriction protein A
MKRLYDSVRWRKARARFLRDHPLCRMCADRGIDCEARVVDHVVPHRGDYGLFWDVANWSPLCASCHSARKQMLETPGKVQPHASWTNRGNSQVD